MLPVGSPQGEITDCNLASQVTIRNVASGVDHALTLRQPVRPCAGHVTNRNIALIRLLFEGVCVTHPVRQRALRPYAHTTPLHT